MTNENTAQVDQEPEFLVSNLERDKRVRRIVRVQIAIYRQFGIMGSTRQAHS